MRLVKTCCAVAFAIAASAGPAMAQTSADPPQPTHPVAHARMLTRFSDATSVQLRDVAAFVRVIPENRTDVAVGLVTPGALSAPEYRVSRRRLTIDGKLRRQIRTCRVSGADGFEVQTARHGRLSGAQLPVIELHVPQNAVVAASGAVRMHVGPAQSATIELSGCGDADIERVEDEAEIAVSGTQDVRLYEAGSATIALAGAGDIVVGVVREGLTLSVAGAGDFEAARADGPTTIVIQGAGDVQIRDGRATNLSVVIAGGGDVTHNGSAASLDAVILGGGDVHVRRVDGEVSRRVLGGGEVTVGR
ncbi:MAG: GIN domain-containing protein [Caulobacteraceae bacterium]